MFDRSYSWTPRYSERATSLLSFGALVLLALAVLGMEARAEDGQSVASSTDPSPAMLQVARAPSSATHHEEAANVPGLAGFDAPSLQDEIQPLSHGLDLSLEQIGRVHDTDDDNEQNAARVARIASCYEASLGRYHSEERGAFTNSLSDSTNFDTNLDVAMTHFTALKASRRQFDSCSRF